MCGPGRCYPGSSPSSFVAGTVDAETGRPVQSMLDNAGAATVVECVTVARRDSSTRLPGPLTAALCRSQ